MHGEAVNVDGFLCLVIAKRRGMISQAVLDRVFRVMKNIGLPTIHEGVELALMVKVSRLAGPLGLCLLTACVLPIIRVAGGHRFCHACFAARRSLRTHAS